MFDFILQFSIEIKWFKPDCSIQYKVIQFLIFQIPFYLVENLNQQVYVQRSTTFVVDFVSLCQIIYDQN
jgi:hypothetical protein